MKFLITSKEKKWLEHVARQGCTGSECEREPCPINMFDPEDDCNPCCEIDMHMASIILNNMVLVD